MVPSAAASPLRTYVFTCISPYTSMYYTIYIVYVDYVPTVLTTEVPYINYLMHVYLSRVARLSLYLYMCMYMCMYMYAGIGVCPGTLSDLHPSLHHVYASHIPTRQLVSIVYLQVQPYLVATEEMVF
ncbi:hypothetical protein F4801DRAFT_294064 [Xylaria longipes]|nr:hypothetical protein F4801DRAFT_294064 [Xylaria longipes]